MMQSLAVVILHEINVNFAFVKQLIKEEWQVELICAFVRRQVKVLTMTRMR